MKCSSVASTTLAWKASARRNVSAQALAVAANFHQRHFALDRPVMAELGGPNGQIDDAVNRHDALQLCLDLLDASCGVPRGNDGDARQMRLRASVSETVRLSIL